MIENSENIVLLNLKDGLVIIELLPDLAPTHVQRFKELVSDGFYDGLKFHRVINNFMAQTGSLSGDGTNGSGITLKDEISGAHHLRGMVSMANCGPNTGDSQFFITFTDCPWLDNKHTIFGRVASGMEYVDKINNGGTQHGGVPLFYGSADKILSMKLLDETSFPVTFNFEDTGPLSNEYMYGITLTEPRWYSYFTDFIA